MKLRIVIFVLACLIVAPAPGGAAGESFTLEDAVLALGGDVRSNAVFAIVIAHFEDGSSRYASLYFGNPRFPQGCMYGTWTYYCPDPDVACMARDLPSSVPQCTAFKRRAARH